MLPAPACGGQTEESEAACVKKRREDRGLQVLAVCLCAAVMLGCVISINVSLRGLRSLAATPAPTATPEPVPTATPTPTPVPTPSPVPTPTPEPYFPPDELLAARERNPHVIAWLDIPDTATRYPILLHPEEDNHYLDITIDGNEGYPGSIYTNSMEGANFDTFNTVIYGHNMRDGSYFGGLRRYFEQGFLQEHREIDIYTFREKRVYDVFAVVVYDDRYITAAYHDDKPAERKAFLDSLRDFGEDCNWLDDVEVDADSRIITLSTCVGVDDRRTLILAVERAPAATAAVD